jgi:hypothetical protein
MIKKDISPILATFFCQMAKFIKYPKGGMYVFLVFEGEIMIKDFQFLANDIIHQQYEN